MDTLRQIFCWIGVAATLSAMVVGGMVALLKYEDRQWRKKQDGINGACGTPPTNDN